MAQWIFPLEIIIFLCPLIAVIGAVWLLTTIRNHRSKLPPLISTAVGIAPGLFLLWIF